MTSVSATQTVSASAIVIASNQAILSFNRYPATGPHTGKKVYVVDREREVVTRLAIGAAEYLVARGQVRAGSKPLVSLFLASVLYAFVFSRIIKIINCRVFGAGRSLRGVAV